MRFVVIASPRTGSSHLVTMLGSHPDILCNGNVFHPRSVYVFWPKDDLTPNVKAELLDQRTQDPDALLERVFSTDYGRGHVGFKIFSGQNDRILDKMIDDPSVRKVVLFRENVLANYSSALAAQNTGRYAVRDGTAHEIEHTKVKFSKRKFEEFYSEYIGFYRDSIHKLNTKRQIFHFINYNEVNDPLLFSSLVNFIGADASSSAPVLNQRKKHVKQNSPDIISRFSNPEVVETFLQERDRMHWAREGETALNLSLSMVD